MTVRRLTASFLALAVLQSLIGCAGPQAITPGQLALRAMEVRPIDAPMDIAFRAATHAFFALGFTVKFSDHAGGILTASSEDKGTGKKVAWILLFGLAGAFIDTKTTTDITLFLSPAGEKRTNLRVGVLVDGKVVTEQEVIDRIWVITQREALVEQGANIPPDLEEKARKILEPPKPPPEPQKPQF